MVDALTLGARDPVSSEPTSPTASSEDTTAFDALHNQEQAGEKPMGVGSSLVHAGLAVGECVPEFGHLFAAGNAALYAMQGHKGEAALSAAAAIIPGADQAAGVTQVLRMGAHLGMGSLGVGHAELDKHRAGAA